MTFYGIAVEAGIPKSQQVTNVMDPGFHRGDGKGPIFSQLLKGYNWLSLYLERLC
jgi:hypothetical protein